MRMGSGRPPVKSCAFCRGVRVPACAARAWNASMYLLTVDVKGSLARSARWLVLRGGPNRCWHRVWNSGQSGRPISLSRTRYHYCAVLVRWYDASQT